MTVSESTLYLFAAAWLLWLAMIRPPEAKARLAAMVQLSLILLALLAIRQALVAA